MLEEFVEDCFLWDGAHVRAGKEREESSSCRGRDARGVMNWPQPPFPCGDVEEDVEKIGVKLSPEEGWREGL